MKILHILDHSLPLHSGYTFRSQNIFRAQSEKSWHPVILTSPKHEQSWKKKCDLQEKVGDFLYYRSGRIKRSNMSFVEEIRLMAKLFFRMMKVLKKEKPDIIHAHSPVLNALPALAAGRLFGIPVMYEIRAFWEDAAVDHETYEEDSFKYKLVRGIETFVCKMTDHVFILCNGLKKDLVSRGIAAEKITPVFNGINPENFKPCEPDQDLMEKFELQGKKIIGFIGSFYRYEGLDLLIEAFSKIALKNENAVLLLVGGGEMEKALKEKAVYYNIEEKVVMPGRIDHEKIPGVYALIDILVYPRYSMRLTELVTPLKPLEAMAIGKALIASDVGGHIELIQNGRTGLLFKSGDADALKDAIQALLSDDSLFDSLKKYGYDWVREHHTWGRTTSVYESIYVSSTNK